MLSITKAPIADLLLVSWLYSSIISSKLPFSFPTHGCDVEAAIVEGFHALKIISCPIYSDSNDLQISSHGLIAVSTSAVKLFKKLKAAILFSEVSACGPSSNK